MDKLVQELKRIKKEERLSFVEFSRRLGISIRALKYWFSGEKKPSPLAREKIIWFLKNEKKGG